MIEIAVDMMGSDLGPKVLGEAVKNYSRDHKNVSFTCFGEEGILKETFSGLERIRIVPTTETIPMEIKPLDFLRKKNSSMYKAIEAVKEKKCQAVVSAGSTGRAMTAAPGTWVSR